MEWFKSGAGQLIALVTIVGTLAGFGYTGATYVNRLENLERKMEKAKETDDDLGEIEKRFETLETSIEYINKSLDNESTGIISKLYSNKESISLLSSQVEGISVSIKELEKDINKLEDKNSNPLAQ